MMRLRPGPEGMIHIQNELTGGSVQPEIGWVTEKAIMKPGEISLTVYSQGTKDFVSAGSRTYQIRVDKCESKDRSINGAG